MKQQGYEQTIAELRQQLEQYKMGMIIAISRAQAEFNVSGLYKKAFIQERQNARRAKMGGGPLNMCV